MIMNIIIILTARYLVFISAAVAAFYFFKQPRQKQKEMLIFAAILLPLSYIAAKIISHFYFDPRPFVQGHFMPLIPHAADNGFPSDHTLLGAAIAAIIFCFNKKLGSFLLFFAILVGFARILAGVHHFTDIAGSILVVLAVYLLCEYMLFRSPWRIFRERL
jgi:undecaprenyl-diphosphatase